MKKLNYYFFFLLLLAILLVSAKPLLKSQLNPQQKIFLKKYFFPYKYIFQIETDRAALTRHISQIEERLGKVNKLTTQIEYGLMLEKLNNDFVESSSYIDFHNENLIIASKKGVLGYFYKSTENANPIYKEIYSNINEFINEDQFIKSATFSIKDIHINNDKFFISYTEEIRENCWNISILFSEMNYKKINFKKIFSNKECATAVTGAFTAVTGAFNANQSGGRIITLDDNHIAFSVGDFKKLELAQDKKSINGKIIRLNLNDYNYKIISMGHRNPQGLFYDRKNNFIIETEHGPDGGDEVNIININQNLVPNYGWPMASYGEHYGRKSKDNEDKYKLYPLLKSHSENGFVEPLISFQPSIGISEVTKVKDEYYVASSLRARSIYFFNISKQKKVNNFFRVSVGERVRDMIYKNNKIYLFLDNTNSVGVIDLTKFEISADFKQNWQNLNE